MAVRWSLRLRLPYADVVLLLAKRGVHVDNTSVFDWVQRFAPLYMEIARRTRRRVGCRWGVDETYVKVAGVWRYVYRAIDKAGQVVDVFLSERRETEAAAIFFEEDVCSEVLATLETIPAQWGSLGEMLRGRAALVQRWEQDQNRHVRSFARKARKVLLGHADESDAATVGFLEDHS